MYLKTLESLKESAIKEQIVVGRKFIGVSFKSQPKIVHFKVKFFYSYYAYKNSKNILKNFRILMLEIIIQLKLFLLISRTQSTLVNSLI